MVRYTMAKTRRGRPRCQRRSPKRKKRKPERKQKPRKSKRQGGVIERLRFRAPDGTTVTLPFWQTDSVYSIKKQLYAKTGKWYNICSENQCVGENKDNHLYSTLREAGMLPIGPRLPHQEVLELYLVAARGPGGTSPFSTQRARTKSFAFIPFIKKGRQKTQNKSKSKSKSKSKKTRKGRRATYIRSMTHKGPEFGIGKMIFAILEETARGLEDTNVVIPLEEYRLRKQRDGEEADRNEEEELYSAGTERVERGVRSKIGILLSAGHRWRDENIAFPLPGGRTVMQWPGGRVSPRTRITWRGALNEYMERGEESFVDSPDPDWRWSEYLGGIKRSL